MDLYRLDSDKIVINFVTKYDHMVFETLIRSVVIYDLTGYPYTINPREFMEHPNNYTQTERELMSIKGTDE